MTSNTTKGVSLPHPRVDELFKKGDRSMIVAPLDYKILELLTDEGTTFADLYPIGTVVSEVAEKLGTTSSLVSSRVRVFALIGLAVKVKQLGAAAGWAWQRTQLGKEELAKWQQQNPS